MYIRIYQVNIKIGAKEVFNGLDGLKKMELKVDPSKYYLAWEGNTSALNLEDVYSQFNCDRPDNFICRSMSVSDVVEVVAEDGSSKFFFCDSIGFTALPEFDTEQVEKCKIVLVRPMESAVITWCEPSLEHKQHIVGGDIEAVYPFEDRVALIVNEDGIALGLPLNRPLYAEDESGKQIMYDIIKGTFFVIGCGEEDFRGLTDEEAEKYKKVYRSPIFFSEKTS